MNEALVFKNGEKIIVTAEDVLSNYSLYQDKEFVDPEEEFRVIFVSDCKGHTGPYFRFYLSREDYIKLSDEKKTRYDILAKQRHFREGPWHIHWEDNFKKYGKTECFIKSKTINKYKRTDFYYKENKTCVEFQHSYIAYDFEERNEFYEKEELNIVWLYDLTTMQTKTNKEGFLEILENNGKGFFRIAEKQSNLADYPVFIQIKGGVIYRVKELKRKEIENDLKSTIRYFKPFGTYTEDEFINGIIKGDDNFKAKHILTYGLSSLYELWDKQYALMIVTDGKKTIKITRSQDNGMFRDKEFDNIFYNYVKWSERENKYVNCGNTNYPMSFAESHSKKWTLIRSYNKRKIYE